MSNEDDLKGLFEPTDNSERKKWFYKQVGKILFSTKGLCLCDRCVIVYDEGRVVRNKAHADFLYDGEAKAVEVGLAITYYTSREERDAAEVAQKTPVI